MKVYELMNLLGQMKADQDVRIGVCLTFHETGYKEGIAAAKSILSEFYHKGEK